MLTELICAFEVCILFLAFLDLTISLARVLQTSLCPCLAASFRDLFTFSSSRSIAKGEKIKFKLKNILAEGVAIGVIHGVASPFNHMYKILIAG